MPLKHHNGSINYRLFFNHNLANLLASVVRWLEKHPDIHVWDVEIGGATRLEEDWEATIYYFESSEEFAEEANLRK